MSVFLLIRNKVTDEGDTTVPVLVAGFPTTYSIDEGQPIGVVPQFNVPVAGVRFAGGADDAMFADSVNLEWATGAAPAFTGVDDAYPTTRIYTGVNGIESAPITFTINVQDVVTPISVGAASLSITPASDRELVFTVAATNAETFEYQVNDAGSWLPLTVTAGQAVLNAESNASYRVRGVAGLSVGTQSSLVAGNLLSPPAFYNPNAVETDGTQHLVGSTPTGLADGKAGTLVFTIDPTGGDLTSRRIFTSTGHYWSARIRADNFLQIKGLNAAGSTVLELESATPTLVNGGWKQVVCSFDLANGLAEVLVNGVRVTVWGTYAVVNDNLDFTRTNWVWLDAGTIGLSPFIGRVSDCAFHPVYIDLTSLVNVRKFHYHDGRVRDPGADGSNWFGEPALVLLRGETASFQTNRGIGTGYTLTGTLGQAANGPNGSLAVATVTPRKSDEFIDFQSIQTHPNWNTEERWTNTGWHQLAADLHVRKARGVFANNAAARDHVNACYETHGIRFSCTLNEKDDASGTFDLAGTDSRFSQISGANLGLDRVRAVEGSNEITRDFVWERPFTASASTNVLTTTGAGSHRGRGDDIAEEDLGTLSVNQIVNGTAVQLRAGDVNGRETGDASSGVLPTPLVENTVYYVVELSGQTFKLSLTPGGSAIDLTSAGSGLNFVSAWAPRIRDYQAYIWGKVQDGGVYEAAQDAGTFYVIGPSMWKRLVYDYQAVGNISHVYDVNNLHLYGGALKPSLYNIGADNETVTAPIIQAVLDCQIMGNVPCDITETGWNMAGYEYGGSGNISTCPAEVASKYIGRLFAEYWLLKLQGLVNVVNYYSLLDNLNTATRFGLYSYNTATDVYAARLPAYTWRNLNSYAAEATWNTGTLEWDYPIFSVSGLAIIVTPDPLFANPEQIKWFALQKSDGKRLVYIWNDADTYDRSIGGPPGGGGPDEDGYVTVPPVEVNIKITGTSFTTMKVFDPTVLTGDTPNTKRDTPAATPSVATLASTGVNIDVLDQVMVVELTP